MTTTIQDNAKYKVAEIAKALEVDRKTIYNYMDLGLLPFNLLPAKPGQTKRPRYCYGRVINNFIDKYKCQKFKTTSPN